MSKREFLTCPGCNTDIIKSHGEEVKLRAKLLKWNQDGMFAVCKACGIDVSVDSAILKSIQSKFEYIIDEKTPC